MSEEKGTPAKRETETEVRVLVVDDALVDRRMTGAIIEQNDDWCVTYAEDGAEALNSIARDAPTVVVTDLNMPGMDGLELVTTIRRRYPLIPVVLMTAFGNEEIAFQALRVGAASYVPKKYIDTELPETIGRIVAAATEESAHERLMNRAVETTYVLENDLTLISSLVAHLRQGVQQRRLCDENTIIRVATALDEALLNAYYHGNLEVDSALKAEEGDRFDELARERMGTFPYSERRITVTVRYSSAEATFVIRDEGPGFNPDDLADPTDPEYLERPSGRGLLLMRYFMDEVTFNNIGNEVTLVKRRSEQSST